MSSTTGDVFLLRLQVELYYSLVEAERAVGAWQRPAVGCQCSRPPSACGALGSEPYHVHQEGIALSLATPSHFSSVTSSNTLWDS
ncbi:hypothetical protein AMECASPLE_023388 [Ameca splendens]|uniref:Uncharacterized protein n=1 Tax=Ameca splendens TaxID=208324 RepID=A0ABV0XH43_9TELE